MVLGLLCARLHNCFGLTSSAADPMVPTTKANQPKGWDAKERVLVRPTEGGGRVWEEEADPHKTAALPKDILAVRLFL